MKYPVTSILVAILLLSSCAEETTFTTSRLRNSSGKSVVVDIFKAGMVSKHYEIQDQGTITVSENNNRGKEAGLSFPNIDISFMDSAIVTFDGLRRAVHFSGRNRFDSSRVIYFGHTRNLFSEKNYTMNTLSESRHRMENEYIYEFTAQDYQDAK